MDQKKIPITDDLLTKYLLDEASIAEQQAVEKWVELNTGNRKQLEDFRILLEASKLRSNLGVDPNLALEKLNARIDQQTQVKSLNYKQILSWAAVLVVLCSLGLFFYQNTIGSRLQALTAENTLIQELPDGSTATLNKRSSISYEGGFFKKNRQVKLKGEAFFKVVANKRKPFIIEVDGVEVKVVGTAFNVKNEGQETLVSVESGIVSVSYGNEQVRLTAGENVQVSKGRLLKSENLGKLYSYYYSNVLVCDRTPLSELVAVLNKKFQANVVIVNPKINGLPISTTFENNSLREILLVVGQTLKVDIEYGQGIIKIK